MSYLKINNLRTTLDKFSLKIDSLEIKKGSFFGVLGYSGAGKSTFLNLLCGLEKEEKGNIILDGVDITSLAPNRRGIAYVFQNSLLFENLNVRENLEYILKAKSIKKEYFKSIIEEALKSCEASELLDRDITTLSGGEKQRVALSMALMLKPKILILDEPFSNLDTSLKVKMREFLKHVIKIHGVTAVMVTHDKEDAFELFDEMILLNNGSILQLGSPKDIYENPKYMICAKYFGIENILQGSIKDHCFRNDDISLHVEYKDCKNVYIIVPYSAITVSEYGNLETIKESIFIEDRWKNRLQNGLIFYSNSKLEGDIMIKLENSKFKFKEEL